MKKFPFVVCALVILGSTLSAADTQTDALRCEALRLQKESGCHMCLARCDRRAEGSEDFDAARCEASCQSHMQKALGRIEGKPVCSDQPADPQQCEAKMLKVAANHLFCQSRCTQKGKRNPRFDSAQCLATCAAQSEIAYGETMGSSICAQGRIPSDP